MIQILKSKYLLCYEEGKRIGFILFVNNKKSGIKKFASCRGNERSPGHLYPFCLECPYRDIQYGIERKALAKQIELERAKILERKKVQFYDNFGNG